MCLIFGDTRILFFLAIFTVTYTDMKGFSILIIAGLAVFSTVGFNDRTYANAANLTNSIAANTMQVQDTMVLGKLYFVKLKILA